MTLYLKAKSFYPALTQTLGAWVLGNGFSIESRMWDLICNPFLASKNPLKTVICNFFKLSLLVCL